MGLSETPAIYFRRLFISAKSCLQSHQEVSIWRKIFEQWLPFTFFNPSPMRQPTKNSTVVLGPVTLILSLPIVLLKVVAKIQLLSSLPVVSRSSLWLGNAELFVSSAPLSPRVSTPLLVMGRQWMSLSSILFIHNCYSLLAKVIQVWGLIAFGFHRLFQCFHVMIMILGVLAAFFVFVML